MTEALTWMSTDPDKWIWTGAVLIAIAAAALLVEYLIDKRRRH